MFAAIDPSLRATADPLGSPPAVVMARSIHKTFMRGSQQSHVLRGVDLSVTRGECLFLVGPSGSGKSTLLAILGCILSPDSGQVELLGKDVSHFSADERVMFRRERIGFVFQKFHLIRGLNALENVCLPLLLQGHNQSETRKRALAMLEDVGLADFVTADPRRMSSGQCQRIAIARALATDPDLIFADEPTASLDESSGQHRWSCCLVWYVSAIVP